MATIAFNCTPAALDKEMAAAYCSVGITMFEQMVQDGTAPKARRFPGRRRVAWLRSELDAWLAGLPLSDLLPPENTGARKPRIARPKPLLVWAEPTTNEKSDSKRQEAAT